MFKSVLSLLFALTALPAGATTTFYTGGAGLTQFGLDLTTRGLTVGSFMDFTGIAGGTTTISNVAGTGVNFTGNQNIVVNSSYITLSASDPVLQVALPGTVYAIGAYIASAFGTRTWTYGPSGSTLSLTTASTFFGAMSTTPLASLPTLTLSGPVGAVNGINVTSFQIGTASLAETPEPSTMALVGSGLVLFPLIARRMRRRRGAGR